MKPLVSVILPVYNAERFLGESIESILNQSFSDFELLLINDGSTDQSEQICFSYHQDKRIKYIKHDKNKGLIETLNEGFHLAQGRYIARMDADDISLPQRFALQYTFLENNPSISACGTNIESFGEKTFDAKIRFFDPVDIKIALLWHCPICHPTAMIRKKVIDEFRLIYNRDYKHAEDYKFWADMARIGNLSNLPEVLFRYRIHTNQITSPSNGLQWQNSLKIINDQLSDLKMSLEGNDQYHMALDGHEISTNDPFFMKKLELWCARLEAGNKNNQLFDSNYFHDQLVKKIALAEEGFKMQWNDLSFKNKVKFGIKRLFRYNENN